MRKAAVSGMFYEEDKEKLKEQIEKSFSSEFGPGDIGEKKDNKILGAVVPHAGYVYSGPCAAYVYKEIGESKIPDVFIILGTNHTGQGESSVLLDDFETPLGVVKVDKEFGQKLKENCGLEENEELQAEEHSIEVQLPFLQNIVKDKLRIVPIVVTHGSNYKKMAKGIKKTVEEEGKEVCIIASSDFTHYGLNYGYVPFTERVKDNMYKQDEIAIKHITHLDVETFLEYVDIKGATVCGTYAIAVMVEACKLIGCKKGKLLKYYTSADMMGDYSNAVGYASIIIEKK